MEVVNYPYSKTQIWFYMIAFFAILIFLLIVFVINFSDHSTWPLLGIGGIFVCGVLTYLYSKYFRHFKRGEIALELDKEKLQYFIGNKTVFWKDILAATSDSNPKGNGIRIRFSIDGGSDVVINTQFVDGNDKEIYNTVMTYVEKYKSV
jgi:hypothetical protein